MVVVVLCMCILHTVHRADQQLYICYNLLGRTAHERDLLGFADH